MAKKMEIMIKITNEDGSEIVKVSNQRDIPYMEEFDTQGFRQSFGQIETAVLEARKEVSDEAISTYMSEISKKKYRQ